MWAAPLRVGVMAALLAGSGPGAARAAGFAVDYDSARSVGTATAGSASAADASTIFTNPAGLALLDKNEVIAGGDLFLLNDQFQNDGSTILGGAAPTPGGNGRDAIPPTLVPWIYASHRLTPEVTAGLGVFSPFGLRTDYGSDFVGRYQDQVTSLTAIDINPTVAYRPLPWLSLGAGLDVQSVDVRLTQGIDFGSACAAAIGPAACAGVFHLTPGASDGAVDTHGSSFGYGFNVGVLAEPLDGTRVGIAYRSNIDQHIGDGKQSFVVPSAARAFLAAGGTPFALTGSDISTTVPLPGRLTFGLKQRLTPSLDLLLDATLTFWSVFASTSITASNPATGASVVIQQGYRNAWRFAAGLEDRLTERWSLRTGVAYDQTPVPLSAVQASLPDSDRVYLSGGVSFRIDASWSVDVGYSHVFYVNTIPIDRTNATGNTLSGVFTGGGNVLAAQVKLTY